jgi:hypothetical protein
MPTIIKFLLVVLAVLSPSNQPSQNPYALTPFKYANEHGALSFMAHSYLAGKYFGGLGEGDEIQLVYEDRTDVYQIDQILRYDALSPRLFRVEIGESRLIPDTELFDYIYRSNDKRLVLQTCYYEGSGRVFIIAYKKE